MSNPVWPHRRQPTRLHRPWDSPGKNTGVGCHFLLQCMKVKSESASSNSALDSGRKSFYKEGILLPRWATNTVESNTETHCVNTLEFLQLTTSAVCLLCMLILCTYPTPGQRTCWIEIVPSAEKTLQNAFHLIYFPFWEIYPKCTFVCFRFSFDFSPCA